MHLFLLPTYLLDPPPPLHTHTMELPPSTSTSAEPWQGEKEKGRLSRDRKKRAALFEADSLGLLFDSLTDNPGFGLLAWR